MNWKSIKNTVVQNHIVFAKNGEKMENMIGNDLMWDMKCRFAPVNPAAKHCRANNTGKRYKLNPGKRKKSGIVGKGYFGCCKKCRMREY